MLNNSREAQQEGRIVNISILIQLVSENYVEVTLTDSGNGIAPDDLRKIGNIDFSKGKKSSESGFGLGLSGAQARIESWQGTWKIESTVGVGTKVTIGLLQIAC